MNKYELCNHAAFVRVRERERNSVCVGKEGLQKRETGDSSVLTTNIEVVVPRPFSLYILKSIIQYVDGLHDSLFLITHLISTILSIIFVHRKK